MLTDPSILEAAYQCFLEEAPGLLETIERELFEFSDDTKVESVNSMMRAAHTIKGGAANVGLDTINKIAHYLEDVFKALASPNLEIDEETKSLLLEGYECLRLPLTAELTQAQVDDTEVLERATLVFTRLDEKLGDYIRAAQDAVPTSAELGIDLVQTIFETVVPTHLDELEGALDSADVEGVLRSKVDIFIGFAESLGLPGLGEIANSIQAALDAGSGDAATLARTGLDNFKSAHADVLAGDRDRGGEPSETLLALVAGASSAAANEASGGDLAEANDAEGLATPARNENSQQFTDLDSLFQEPAIANGALDPFAIDEAAIAASADVEAEAMSAEPISPDNPLDSIWGNPIAPEAGAFGEEIGGDLTAAETGANFAANSDNEAAGESPETESQSARDDLDAIFAGNLDAEPNIDLSASPDGEVAETDVDHNLLASLEEAVAGLEVEAPAPQSLVEEPVVEVPKLEKKQARAALKQTVRVELQELETLNYLIGDLLIEQNRNALMGTDAKARIDALEEKLQSSKEAIGQAMSWIESSLPPAVPPALESITAAEAAEPVSGDRISAPSTPPSAPAQDLSQVRSTLQQAMAAIADSSETLQKVKLIAKESQLALRKQQRTSLNMRDELLGSRMAPLENVFNRFPYMIQQLASTHGKDVEFVVRGGHILVDKAVEQKLYDPLLHLIRNALDHGIETTEDRRNSGKRETAKIELIAFYQGCQTVIEIRDNGRGIDPRKICNKLVERDLLSPQEVGGLSDSQIIEFLFEPGFSTASSVSDLSGRGVGLDVVRSQVQSLKGSVAIESTLTVGTTFTLQLPPASQIMSLEMFSVRGSC
ncbi:MAG: Hpt domain-containing protein, partial [Cyanobacteria bacterium J06641_5]